MGSEPGIYRSIMTEMHAGLATAQTAKRRSPGRESGVLFERDM
jgi:hypothetical protein